VVSVGGNEQEEDSGANRNDYELQDFAGPDRAAAVVSCTSPDIFFVLLVRFS
jgi:hypothetical protein